MHAHLCVQCGRRWKQDGALCRTCANDAGLAIGTFERERARVARRRPLFMIDRSPRPPREITVDGVVYEVMFDGS